MLSAEALRNTGFMEFLLKSLLYNTFIDLI